MEKRIWLSGQAAFSDMPDEQLQRLMFPSLSTMLSNSVAATNAVGARAELQRRAQAKTPGR